MSRRVDPDTERMVQGCIVALGMAVMVAACIAWGVASAAVVSIHRDGTHLVCIQDSWQYSCADSCRLEVYCHTDIIFAAGFEP